MYHRRRGNGAALLEEMHMCCHHRRYNDYIVQRIIYTVLGLGLIVYAHPVVTTFYIAGWSCFFYVKWVTKQNEKKYQEQLRREREDSNKAWKEKQSWKFARNNAMFKMWNDAKYAMRIKLKTSQQRLMIIGSNA